MQCALHERCDDTASRTPAKDRYGTTPPDRQDLSNVPSETRWPSPINVAPKIPSRPEREGTTAFIGSHGTVDNASPSGLELERHLA